MKNNTAWLFVTLLIAIFVFGIIIGNTQKETSQIPDTLSISTDTVYVPIEKTITKVIVMHDKKKLTPIDTLKSVDSLFKIVMFDTVAVCDTAIVFDSTLTIFQHIEYSPMNDLFTIVANIKQHKEIRYVNTVIEIPLKPKIQLFKPMLFAVGSKLDKQFGIGLNIGIEIKQKVIVCIGANSDKAITAILGFKL